MPEGTGGEASVPIESGGPVEHGGLSRERPLTRFVRTADGYRLRHKYSGRP